MLPSQKFGSNAAWPWLIGIVSNWVTVLQRKALPEKFKVVRPKTLRFLLFHVLDRFVHHVRAALLRLAL